MTDRHGKAGFTVRLGAIALEELRTAAKSDGITVSEWVERRVTDEARGIATSLSGEVTGPDGWPSKWEFDGNRLTVYSMEGTEPLNICRVFGLRAALPFESSSSGGIDRKRYEVTR